MQVKRPRGTTDILPGQVEKWQALEREIQRLCAEYGYAELRSPIIEPTELFQRGVGETTDVVEKEMYTFQDKGENSLTLRPEGTAPTVRAFVENSLYGQALPAKLYYLGPMFRYDRPQAGRYRQFHQFGVEVLGAQDPLVDVEVIALAMELYQRIGLQNLELHLNSVGCAQCRVQYREILKQFLRSDLAGLCPNCQNRIERNPLRVLDCKEESCQQATQKAPTPIEHLCSACVQHFQTVRQALEDLEILYQLNPRLVRGLDYYQQTTFEILVPGIGAQSAIGGGGRYDGLVEALGGPSTPGVGFAMGLERVFLALEQQGVHPAGPRGIDVFMVTLNPEVRTLTLKLLSQMRKQGLRGDMDYLGRSVKAQMKYAGKVQAQWVVFVGGEEFMHQQVAVRNMLTGQQVPVAIAELEEYLLTANDKE